MLHNLARIGTLVQGSANARIAQISRRIPALETLAAIFFMTSVDYSTRVNVAGGSLSAVLTIVLPIIFAVTLLINLIIAETRLDRASRSVFRSGLRSVPMPLVLFAAYAGVWLLLSPTAEAIQNVMCYLMFVLTILLVVTSLRFDYRSVPRIMGWCAVFSATVYLVQQLLFTSGDVDRPLISDRAIAMICLIGLAVLVPAHSREVDPFSPSRSFVWPLFILAVLLNSLSRTGLIVALVLLLFFAVRVRHSWRKRAVVVSVAIVILSGLAIATYYPPIVSRFTEGDNATVGDISVNTSGRTELWQITYDSALRSPILGNGPGSAKVVIQKLFAIPGTDHPHNDYLRIFNDFGVVGVALFWGGLLFLLVRLWLRARALDEPRHWTAVMALLSVVLVGITDNIIVYQFIMLPVGILIGIALRPDPAPVVHLDWHRRRLWGFSRDVVRRSPMFRARAFELARRIPGLTRLRDVLGGLSDSAFSALSTFTVGLTVVRTMPDSGIALFSLMLTGYVIGMILPRNIVLTHIELSANRSSEVYLPSIRDSLSRAVIPFALAFMLPLVSGIPVWGHVTPNQYFAMALSAATATVTGAILTHMRASMHLVRLHEWAGITSLANFAVTLTVIVGGQQILPERAIWALPFSALACGQIVAMLFWRGAMTRVPVRNSLILTPLRSRLLYLVPIGAAQLMIYAQSTIVVRILGPTESAQLEGARVAASPVYILASGLGVLLVPPLVRGLAHSCTRQTLVGLARGIAIVTFAGLVYATSLVGLGPLVSAALGRDIDSLLASARAATFSVDGSTSMNLGILIALDEFARPAWLSVGCAILGVTITLLLVSSWGLFSVPAGHLVAATLQLAVSVLITRGALRLRTTPQSAPAIT